jgi:hypothetical protein
VRQRQVSVITLEAVFSPGEDWLSCSQVLTLLHHPQGQYSFLRGISAYSAGVVAQKGYEIVHATFSRLTSLRPGFEAIEQHLSGLSLPKVALCAIELRSPRSSCEEEFHAFNSGYIKVLESWGILLDRGLNPIARTNVAPVLLPPPEPSIHGFAYTAPSTAQCQTFVVAGAGELPEGSTNPNDILLCGDVSSAALAEKARFVMSRMQDRLHAMGVSWPQVTAIDVYTARDLTGALVTEILKQASHNTLIWNYARPPIKDLEFEMDLRGVRCEIVLR